MKVALMTAIFGGIDSQKTIPAQSVEYEYHFYNEKNLLLNEELMPDDRRKALYAKTQGHKLTDAEIIIWIDGKIQVLSQDFIAQCIVALGDNDLAILKHHWRGCIYQEVDHIEHCIKHGNEYLKVRYGDRPIRIQADYYRDMGYPENNGLNDCSIICRRNNRAINTAFNHWYVACQYNYYDQIAIQYICWRDKIKIEPITFLPGSYEDVPHKILK